MATIFTVNYSGDYGDQYEFRANATESNVSNSNNTSKVNVDIYLRRTSSSSNGAWNNYGTNWSITIDGTKYSGNSTWDTRNTTAWQHLGSASKTVQHNSNGSKTVTISATHTGNSASGSSKMGNASGSGKFTLTTIPRYASFTTHRVSATELNTISITWAADKSIDSVQYSLNGGSWVTTSGSTYKISNLAPSTTYSIRTRIRNSASGLWTTSNAVKGTTKAISTVTASDFDLGDNVSITFTNPRRNSSY